MTDELNDAERIEQLIGPNEAVKLVVTDDDGACTVTVKNRSFTGTAHRHDGRTFVIWPDGSSTDLTRCLQVVK
jgi:hypothetical protein